MATNFAGREIGPYRIIREIGKGGMSRVYLAMDTSKDREVALKIMTPEAAEDEDYVRRFQREIDIASKLDHPHILPVLDWGRDENVLFLMMPYIKRGTLNDILRTGQVMTPYQAWRMAFQISDALDYAHENGIIHRDVKPHNIMVVNDSHFSLTDFGLVKMANESSHLTQSGSVLGSPSYMSPEQARSRTIDHRSDVYSLGVVLYEALVGRLPYNSASAMEMIGQHVLARPLMPSQIAPDFPAAIEAVLLRALCKDPNARYRSAGDLARALGTVMTELPHEVQNRPLVNRDQVIGSVNLENEPVTIVLQQEPQKFPVRQWLGRLGMVLGGALGGALALMIALNALDINEEPETQISPSSVIVERTTGASNDSDSAPSQAENNDVTARDLIEETFGPKTAEPPTLARPSQTSPYNVEGVMATQTP